jgi:hypothetical protein
MTEHEEETASRGHGLTGRNAAQDQELLQRATRARRDQSCLERAECLMALVASLAIVGLCYSAILRDDLHETLTQFTARFGNRLFCVLGLASGICLLVFMALGVIYRKRLAPPPVQLRPVAKNPP